MNRMNKNTVVKPYQEYCKCRPICKKRRREWRGKILKTSEELLLEKNEEPKHATTPDLSFSSAEFYKFPSTSPPVKICRLPIYDQVDTPCLDYAALAKRLGAWAAVKAYCPFCDCGCCCSCGSRQYKLMDSERLLHRRAHMRQFDNRVKHDYQLMRIMYSGGKYSQYY